MEIFAARPSALGATAHLYVPDYQPGKKKRSGGPSPLCGSQSFAVYQGDVVPLSEALRDWPTPDPSTVVRGTLAWEWCKPCLGHAVAVTGQQRPVLHLVVAAAQARRSA